MAKKKTFYTTYAAAVHWLHNNFILCNNIGEIDPSTGYNYRFDAVNEIYQWFITDANLEDVEYLEKNFGLLFTYSELLDKYILCVDHWGTSWDYVHCPVLTYGAKDDMYPYIESYKELTGQEF